MTNHELIDEAIDLADSESFVDDIDKIERYERIWSELKLSYNHISFNSIGDGFGPGWWGPVVDAFDKIEDVMYTEPSFVFNVRQIKEKFGGLRFYWSLMKSELIDESLKDDLNLELKQTEVMKMIEKIVEQAEVECETRCEVCGQAARLRTTRWHATLCDKHNESRDD